MPLHHLLRSPASSPLGPSRRFLTPPRSRADGRARVFPLRSWALGSDGAGKERAAKKTADIATLGNLCVDVVLNVPQLPPASPVERKAYMERLASSPPDKNFWEAGGNCNLAIAAARLGLHCLTLGHVGDEIYGNFLKDVLREEGVTMVAMNEDSEASHLYGTSYETLLCWVLVDPFQKHGFCSRADFSKEPAFSWMKKLSRPVEKAIEQSRILFCNGYVFDELLPDIIIAALDCAINAGTTVFFDPGPRGRTLSNGNAEERRAVEMFLRLSDVLLFTSEEAEAMTGIADPVKAGWELIKRGDRTKWVIIKMGSKGSILLTKSSISCAPAFKVNVLDTVGCGDSYTAAVAFGFLFNIPAVNTLTLANAVGGATATGSGAGRNVATLGKVLEILRVSNLNEDNKFWDKLIEEISEVDRVILLSRFIINGNGGRITHASVTRVVSELLPELGTKNEIRICLS